MIEVEVRGKIESEEFDNILAKLKEKTKFIKEKDRLSFIYFRDKVGFHDVAEIQDDPVDLKVRITNKKAELVMKYGRWGATENRKEFLFPIATEQFGEALEFLKCLDWKHGVLMDTRTYVFEYKDIEFAVVKSGDICYFEAEKLCEKECEAEQIIKELQEACKELGLEIYQEQELIDLLNSANERQDRLFNMEQDSFEEIKERFGEYF